MDYALPADTYQPGATPATDSAAWWLSTCRLSARCVAIYRNGPPACRAVAREYVRMARYEWRTYQRRLSEGK